MPQFESEFVGGPADGLPVTTIRAPRHGEILGYTDQQGNDHAYVFRSERDRPPAWRYDGIIKSAESKRTGQ